MERIRVPCTISFLNIRAGKELEDITTIIVIVSQELPLSF